MLIEVQKVVAGDEIVVKGEVWKVKERWDYVKDGRTFFELHLVRPTDEEDAEPKVVVVPIGVLLPWNGEVLF